MSEHEPPEADAVGDADEERLDFDAWTDALSEGTLLGQRCGDCSHATAAPKAACARCGSRDLSTVELPTSGEVYSETTITVPPEGFEGPYQVALVDLGEARVLVRVDGEAEIGDRVVYEETTVVERYPAPVFAPAEE